MNLALFGKLVLSEFGPSAVEFHITGNEQGVFVENEDSHDEIQYRVFYHDIRLLLIFFNWYVHSTGMSCSVVFIFVPNFHILLLP